MSSSSYLLCWNLSIEKWECWCIDVQKVHLACLDLTCLWDYQISSRMLQAWTLSKLNWNLIYIHINLCFPFLALFCLYFSCIFILFVVLFFSALRPLEEALYKCWYCIVLYCIDYQRAKKRQVLVLSMVHMLIWSVTKMTLWDANQ